MQILSYVFSTLSIICMISASLIKGDKMKTILFLVFCGNFLTATSYIAAGGGINGAISCYLGSAQTIVNYFFQVKGRTVPTWLIVIYAVLYVALNIFISGITPLGILVIVASLTFIMCIGQTSGAKYRFWTIVNMVLWCTYDILSKSYGALLTHICLFAFTVIGMIIHDRKKKEESL